MALILVSIVLPALLALAAGYDLASYTIPNRIGLALVAAFFLFYAVSGQPLTFLGSHLAAFAVALAAGFAFFAARFIGGGDAKLFAATALWFGFSDLLAYTLVSALLGGGLTLAILMARRVPLPAGLVSQAWIVRLHDSKSGIPYGVALAAGALFVLSESHIFRLVVNA
ncbi:prepilin peptidase CpaA [Rhizomicrobium palustre]|uniref:Prepilin peptidase CpaA n=1 Tax=Rhizomicrobium palustre TaxID=189966 RepID=A0A846MY34_9PROT|nr:prepilin peptidase [Rhizomicrobium palustre]NIK87887.1 prepilin peptidase CpaA [Rhizomicrobium palustre]